MDGTYAPQSPDLSGFHSSPSKQQRLYQTTSQSNSYAPRSPVIPTFNTTPTNAYQPSPQKSEYELGGNEYSEYGSSYMPPIPKLPDSHSFAYSEPASAPYYQAPLKQENSYNSYSSLDTQNTYHSQNTYNPQQNIYNTPAAMSHDGIKAESSFPSTSAAPQYKDPNPNNIEIRTKFPVARIKRIMQADEEVGKVAQVTPVAVNKALELFMIALVDGAAKKAKEKGGKRVTAQHLKAVVEGDEQFDFLKEIVERVADVQENAGGEGRKRKEKVKKGSESGSEEEVKVKKGKGRRKKSDD